MPKLVDHRKRRELLAQAAWRVIRRAGLDGLSVRTVAEEAGMSLGSLRHYFGSQAELLAFSMRLVSEQATRRIEGLPYTGEPRADILLIIAELLPLDEVRREEAEVWLAFAAKAVSDPAIGELYREVHEQLYAGFRRMLEGLAAVGLAKPGLRLETETKRLHALVDGLVLHHAAAPERVASEDMLAAVTLHLDSLLEQPAE
ncbi:TetR family transcriptional regulator C-terminal domain-containing protein [Paenibacillus sp. CC-CFT747]|nr:TetR family transcriptional regulator C-terminal domain-containing protein [Paenibacillus sp. CC-CFT747]